MLFIHVVSAGGSMARNLLVVLADPDSLHAVRAALDGARESGFVVEWAGRCSSAIERLAVQREDAIAAVVTDLQLPDLQGLAAFDSLLAASPRTPILVLSRPGEEPVARLAMQRGACDYLLLEHVDGYWLPKTLNGILERAAHAEGTGRTAEHAKTTLDSIGDAVVSTDIAGNITYLNPVAERMTGWSGPEASGRPLQDVVRIIDADSRQPVPNPLAMAIREDAAVGLSPNCLLVHRDGHESAIEDTASPIHDQNGRVVGAVIVFHDVGVARAMSMRMSHLAQHDPLTGLPNRLLLSDRIERSIASAHRNVTSLAVLFIDLNRFKRINDSFGHAVGDQVLQSVARRLGAGVRKSDTVSRLGGDEFVVMLSEVSCEEDAAFSADKLLAAIAAPHRIAGQDLYVTASVGIAMYPAHGMDAKSLLNEADFALLRAKSLRQPASASPEELRWIRLGAPPHRLLSMKYLQLLGGLTPER
jgi:diguanylate cyclase (GGDEF)-like protein/PAS domain S-box-containing protein